MSGPTKAGELTPQEELKELIHNHPDVIQYRNTIKYVQGSTGITIERMIEVLEKLCLKIYLEGVQAGLTTAEKIASKAATANVSD